MPNASVIVGLSGTERHASPASGYMDGTQIQDLRKNFGHHLAKMSLAAEVVQVT